MRFIDLFCGIGGFRLGLERANRTEDRGSQEDQKKETERRQQDRGNNSQSNDREFTCVWSCDIDKWARQIYKKNFREEPEGDITKISADSIPNHDLLCAGFPCQSFSIAGKRKGFSDTRGTLFFDFCRVLRTKRPSYCLLENVKGLLSNNNGEDFKVILESLDELGYGIEWQVLNSKHFGVPQNRERVFIIGHLRGKPRPEIFPIGETNQISVPKNECQWVSEGKGIAYALDANFYKGVAQQARTMIKIISYTRHKDFSLTHHEKDIANTVKQRAGNQDQFLNDGIRIRRLTPIECERLQGFPDNWTQGVSDTQRYKLLGNAVTVNVIEFLGNKMRERFGA